MQLIEVRSVSAVFAASEVFRLNLLKLAENFVGVDTGFEEGHDLRAFQIGYGALDSVVVDTLDHHTLVGHTRQLFIDLNSL